MIESEALVLPPDAAGAAKAYLRVERADEDALIAGLAAAAAELCEAFTGQAAIVRGFAETMPPGRAWRLGRAPVRAVTLVEALPAAGPAETLAAGAYEVDIDRRGEGRVRLTGAGAAGRIRIAYRAGLAESWAELPAPLRHGIVRLTAHLYASRTTDRPGPAEPPAAVAALWRPYRRLRLS